MPQPTDEPDPANAADWVSLAGAALALDVTTRQTHRVAAEQGWRRRPDTRPVQFAFTDVLATYRARTEQETTP